MKVFLIEESTRTLVMPKVFSSEEKAINYLKERCDEYEFTNFKVTSDSSHTGVTKRISFEQKITELDTAHCFFYIIQVEVE